MRRTSRLFGAWALLGASLWHAPGGGDAASSGPSAPGWGTETISDGPAPEPAARPPGGAKGPTVPGARGSANGPDGRAAPADTVDLESVIRAARSRLEALSRRGAGLQAAVVAGGGVIWTGAFGPADAEAGRPVTDDTRFRIYSLSKPMTAVAAVRLAGQGALDLSAPIRIYVPSFPEKEGVVTSMHLIRHTSGIRHYRDDEEARSQRHCETVDEALAIFRDDPLVHPPGAGETYSTWGYVLLSAVLEGAAGASYPDVMRTTVFEPAGMERTVVGGSGAAAGDAAAAGVTSFYRLDARKGRVPARSVDVSCKWGGGAWLSTATDVGRFLAASLDGTLLPAETARGLVGGGSVYEAMGVGPGGLALARADLDRGVALVVLTNAPGERFGSDVRAAADELFARLQASAQADPGEGEAPGRPRVPPARGG